MKVKGYGQYLYNSGSHWSCFGVCDFAVLYRCLWLKLFYVNEKFLTPVKHPDLSQAKSIFEHLKDWGIWKYKQVRDPYKNAHVHVERC